MMDMCHLYGTLIYPSALSRDPKRSTVILGPLPQCPFPQRRGNFMGFSFLCERMGHWWACIQIDAADADDEGEISDAAVRA